MAKKKTSKSKAVAIVEPVDPWERQPREPDRAWEAFVVYRDLGPGERSFSKAARVLGKAVNTVAEFAEKNNWRERVEAFDREEDRRKRAEMDEMRREADERHRRAASGMHALGMRKLFGYKEVDPDTGEEIVVEGISPDDLDSERAAAYLRDGFKMERTTLGLATDLLGNAGAVPAREVSQIIDAMIAAVFETFPEATDRFEEYLERVRAIAASRRPGT